jgi:hypothetical protein
LAEADTMTHPATPEMEGLGKMAVAKKLRVHPRTLQLMIDTGQFPPGQLVGKRYFWSQEQVDTYLATDRRKRKK